MKATGVLPAGVSDIDILRAFHGHLGPYVMAGLRLGRAALAHLAADPHFGIEAEVTCPDATPVSCALDGIQFASGCTTGKQNLRHLVGEGVTARFRNRTTGQTITLRLLPEAMARGVAEMERHNDEAGAALIEQMPEAELIEIVPEA